MSPVAGAGTAGDVVVGVGSGADVGEGSGAGMVSVGTGIGYVGADDGFGAVGTGVVVETDDVVGEFGGKDTTIVGWIGGSVFITGGGEVGPGTELTLRTFADEDVVPLVVVVAPVVADELP